jgi:Ca-activated chloride channel family protein
MWARARIRDLEDRYVTCSGDRTWLEQQIIAISLRHRVLSRFTAFLAVDRTARLDSDGNPRLVAQPVELPQGWGSQSRANFVSNTMNYGSFDEIPDDALDRLEITSTTADDSMAVAPPSLPAPMSPLGNHCHQAPRDDRAKTMEQIDTAPYQLRVRELADGIEGAAVTNDRSLLDLLVGRLFEFIEDALSVGVGSGWLAEVASVAEQLCTHPGCRGTTGCGARDRRAATTACAASTG